jgi:membrane carboxypeptidase/penicillin-binding protein PbpC
MPANEWCPSRQRERLPLTPANEPTCSWHHMSDGELITIWPPKYREWARSSGLLAVSKVAVVAAPQRHQMTTATAEREPLQIVNPPSGATYFIDPTLRREFQTVALRVVVPTPGPIEWKINDRSLGTASSDSSLSWSLVPGTHRISARDERGRTAESSVVVK